MFVNRDTRTFDHERLYEVTQVVCRNLNKIIDINYYPVQQAEYSNKKNRPIGLGVQGLADAFILLRLPFDSPEAQTLNGTSSRRSITRRSPRRVSSLSSSGRTTRTQAALSARGYCSSICGE